MITNKNYNFDLASLSDKKMYNFDEEVHFDERGQGRKSTRDRTLIKLLKSPGLNVSASVVSKTIILLSNTNDLYDRLKLLLQEKHAGNNSNILTRKLLL